MNNNIENSFQSILRKVAFIISEAVSSQNSFALYRLPNSDHFTLIVGQALNGPFLDDLNSNTGFSFVPFNSNEESSAVLIKCLQKYEFTLVNEGDLQLLNNICKQSVNCDFSKLHYVTYVNNKSTSKPAYISLVDSGIKHINNSSFRKVVLAKQTTEEFKQHKLLLSNYFKMAQEYPNTLASFVSIYEIGTWLTATPEILVSVNKDKVFKTVALAGTQKRTVENLKDALWSQKEIEEQSFVSKYVINCFKKIRVREYDDIGPKTVPAGKLLHLRTDFYVNLNEVEYPDMAQTMLGLLHPTSAVCGMPKEGAKTFILKNEDFNREYFSGFLGPVNINGETHQYVNLRCAQVFKDSIRYYAGAGITEDSVAEKEWEETEMKINTLRSIFGNQ